MAAKESDDKIQKITKLLEKGGTMLAMHHECGAPMFRFQGKVICPVCDLQEKQPIEQSQEKIEPPKIADTAPQSLALNKVIFSKIQNLAASLEAETDLGRVREKMECIEEGLKILKLLREQANLRT